MLLLAIHLIENVTLEVVKNKYNFRLLRGIAGATES